MIPSILHFVFGMAPDFGGKPFSLPHYLAIRSAVELNKPSFAIFHYQYEPRGEYWERARPLLTLNRITAPDSFMGRPLFHVAHKADVVRLQALKETGGIYLDLDTISVRGLNDLMDNDFVIGEELPAPPVSKNLRQRIKNAVKRQLPFLSRKREPGLCNAVLLSANSSPFVNRWLEQYSSFRSTGRDKFWNEHSVQVPMQLAKQYPNELTIVGPYGFHYPLYTPAGLRSMFVEANDFPKAYLHHLWESFSWEPYLSKLTEEDIRTKDTTYNLIARRFL